MNTKRTLDLMIPDNCRYVTLDADIYVLHKETDNPVYLCDVFDDMQGQWIVKLKDRKEDDDKYLGIVDEGSLILTLSEPLIVEYASFIKSYFC